MDYRAALLGLLPSNGTKNGENIRCSGSLPYRPLETNEVGLAKRQPHDANERAHPQRSSIQFHNGMNYKAALLNTLPRPSGEELRAQREESNWRSGFLRLPAELRNKIYLDVLHFGSLVRVCRGTKLLDRADFSLLHLSRAVRRDTVPIYFGANRYSFDLTLKVNYERARAFLLGLPAEAIASLRRLYFQAEAVCRCKTSTGHISCMIIYVYIDADEWRRNGVTYSYKTKYAYKGGLCEKKDIESKPRGKVKAGLEKITGACKTQSVRKEDLEDLLDALKPLASYKLV